MANKCSFNLNLKFWISGFLIPLLLAVPRMGVTANFEAGESVIVTMPMEGDSYLAGSEVDVHANVMGDLCTVGGKVHVRDSVFQDLMIGGGEVEVSGYVGDDLRILGGNIILSAQVVGDVFVTGGELRIAEGVVIGGDLVVTAGKVSMEGTVQGQVILKGGEMDFRGKAEQNVKFAGGQLSINGEIMGAAQLRVEEIKLGENARFHGKVEYWRKSGEMNFGSSLMGVEAIFDPELEPDITEMNWKYMGMGFLGFWIIRLLSVSLLLLVANWLFKNAFQRAGTTVLEQPVRSLGLGLIYLLGIPISALVLMVLVIGFPLGVFTMVNYLFLLWFGQVLAMLVFAHAVNIRYEKGWSNGMILLAALVGFLALKTLSWIPFLGSLLVFAVLCLGIGALTEHFSGMLSAEGSLRDEK